LGIFGAGEADEPGVLEFTKRRNDSKSLVHVIAQSGKVNITNKINKSTTITSIGKIICQNVVVSTCFDRASCANPILQVYAISANNTF
jgi:hypothetical protein